MKFLARKCVQMKREQADKLCTDGVGATGRLTGGAGQQPFTASLRDMTPDHSPMQANTRPYRCLCTALPFSLLLLLKS